MSSGRIQCLSCKHYYITWDTQFPYGCRAMQFKGAQIPCIVVRQTSGKPCLSFEAKANKEKPQS